MGVYLSTPNTEKNSTDQECSNFTYGASSMQGWRMSQEDAHNCIPNFDGSNTAFFAVYDGHGGAEVAQYCAEHFPEYLKNLDKFKNKEIGPALEEAFLGFDSHLLTEEVQKALKVSAGLDDIVEDEEEKVRQKNEAEMLRQEADMPIEELMAQYEGAGMPAEIKNLRKKKQINSPMIRAKRPCFGQGDDEDEGLKLKDTVPPEGSVIPLRATADIQEKLANGHAENENNLNREKEQSDILQKAQGGSSASSGSDIRKMECDSVIKTDEESIPTSTQQVESSEACSSSVLSSSSSSSSSCSGGQSVQNASVSSTDNNQEAVVSKCEIKESSEADSTSQETDTAQGESSSQKFETVESPSSTRVMDSSARGSAGSTNPDHISNGDSGGSSQSKETPKTGGKKQCKSRHIEERDSEEDDLEAEDSDDEDVEFNSSDEDEDDDDSDDSEESEEEEDDDDELCYPSTSDQNNDEPGYCSGCTSVVAVIQDKEVVVANAGDSRCILCRDGKALDLSFDHKPEDDIERNRIVAAGGKVTSDGRVNGGLNLSRAIGDHFYKRNKDKDPKEQMITALPDLQSATLQETDQFMVLACDGIWNYMTSQEVVDFVSERLKDPEKKKKPSVICEEIFDYCLAPNTLGDGTGCDNMTCIIVTFDQMWNNNQNKRSADQLDGQPEKRAKVEQT